jgi:hypothetical protein
MADAAAIDPTYPNTRYDTVNLHWQVKHYNQARMLDASRRYGATIFELREALLAVREGEHGGSDR